MKFLDETLQVVYSPEKDGKRKYKRGKIKKGAKQDKMKCKWELLLTNGSSHWEELLFICK
jgi:hypothetical protein